MLIVLDIGGANMFTELAYNFMKILQEFYREQKHNFKLFVKGEEAILIYLSKNKDSIITPSEISDIFNISTARVASSLNSLETKELVTREIDKDDRRKIIIKLTKKGNELAEQFKTENLKVTVEILSRLGEEDSKTFLNIVEKLKNILKEEEDLC